jgi:predicted phosphoribosyltransferase
MNEPTRRFRDRTEAGQLLAFRLMHYAGRSNVLVLALPRGGMPVAFEIAQALRAPLDVFLVRKLGVPGREELAMGAVASGNVRVLQSDVVEALQIPRSTIEVVTAEELKELTRREQIYRDGRPSPQVQGHEVILVDDGLATGSTMQAAVAAVKRQCPERIIVAVPVAARRACEGFQNEVEEIICLKAPQSFEAVGLWYEDFSQVTDEDVRECLRGAEEISAATKSARSIRFA